MQPTIAILEKINQNSNKNKDEVFTRLYRYLLRADIYYVAYKNLYANSGATTKGVNDDTADGFSENKVNKIIESLAEGSYQPKPTRRTYIAKVNGKLRPLGIPTFTDKLVQEVLRMILEAVYEPVFSEYSHGFRPNRSCHTALESIKRKFSGTKWSFVYTIAEFEYRLINNDTEYEIYSAYITGNVVIPSIIDGKFVTSIANGAFMGNENLMEITIPSSVRTIGECAFFGCINLKIVNIESNSTLINIGRFAFAECSSLKTIIIPCSVTEISESAFFDCLILTDIDFEESSQLNIIGNMAFFSCKSLTDIIIPNNVISIGNYAFNYCSNLTNITLSESLEYIGKHAFAECPLNYIIIPGKVTVIDTAAFLNCSNLNNITFASNSLLISIEDSAFRNCVSLTNITIPNNVENIGYRAFENCTSLATISFKPNSMLANIGAYAFKDCLSLTSITLSCNITNIGNGAFENCMVLTIYTEWESRPIGWVYVVETKYNEKYNYYYDVIVEYWNNQNCLVFWKSTLSDDKDYVVSFKKDSFHGISAPCRDGYTFGGWYANPSFTGTSYTATEIAAAPNGIYYAKWI